MAIHESYAPGSCFGFIEPNLTSANSRDFPQFADPLLTRLGSPRWRTTGTDRASPIIGLSLLCSPSPAQGHERGTDSIRTAGAGGSRACGSESVFPENSGASPLSPPRRVVGRSLRLWRHTAAADPSADPSADPRAGLADSAGTLGTRNPPFPAGFRRADEGTRTLDLLHGNPLKASSGCSLLHRNRS
jgi:hypothetical protein